MNMPCAGRRMAEIERSLSLRCEGIGREGKSVVETKLRASFWREEEFVEVRLNSPLKSLSSLHPGVRSLFVV